MKNRRSFYGPSGRFTPEGTLVVVVLLMLMAAFMTDNGGPAVLVLFGAIVLFLGVIAASLGREWLRYRKVEAQERRARLESLDRQWRELQEILECGESSPDVCELTEIKVENLRLRYRLDDAYPPDERNLWPPDDVDYRAV